MQTLDIAPPAPNSAWLGKTTIKALLASATMVLYIWGARRRGRGEMALLNEHILLDVGIDPLERDSECAKPFWKA